jgi:hypothetical protein
MMGEMKIKNDYIEVLVPVLIGILILMFFLYMFIGRYGDSWKKRTTPLSQETITVLCKNFDLKQDHKLCAGKKDIYGPDFYDIIRDTFRPYDEYNIRSSDAATYDEVEEKIGAFKYDCYPITQEGDGFSYFDCAYDLRGDSEFIISIMYTYPENAVFRIYTPMGYDGE